MLEAQPNVRAADVLDPEHVPLDAAMRPNLVGGAAVFAEAIVAAGNRIDVTALTRYAQELAWAAALRRIGPIADALEVEGLAGRLQPLKPPTADLEPGANKPRVCEILAGAFVGHKPLLKLPVSRNNDDQGAHHPACSKRRSSRKNG